MLTRLATVVLASALLVACIQTMARVMKSWEGRSIDDVVVAWGPPDSQARLSDGRRVMTWKRVWGSRSGESYRAGTCVRTFVVGEGGVIDEWSFTGCRRWWVNHPF